jgi:hypothetical protein
MPEVGGDLVDYFSPYNPQQCLDKLVDYMDDTVLATKAAAIEAHYRRTTWDDSYRQMVDIVGRLT